MQLRNNRDSLYLTMPFVLWSALVMVIYLFSYMTLRTVGATGAQA